MVSLVLMMTSGFGLGGTIFLHQPIEIVGTEIPASLVFIICFHLICAFLSIYKQCLIGRLEIFLLLAVSALVSFISKSLAHLVLVSSLMMYAVWAILQIYTPQMVPTKCRGFVLCLGFSVSMIGENLEIVQSFRFTTSLLYLLATMGVWFLPTSNCNDKSLPT